MKNGDILNSETSADVFSYGGYHGTFCAIPLYQRTCTHKSSFTDLVEKTKIERDMDFI
jgi:hypothetical protein